MLSRISKKKIQIPSSINVVFSDGNLNISSGSTSVKVAIPTEISILIDDGLLAVKLIDENLKLGAILGTYVRIVSAAIKGVLDGHKVSLKFSGVGFKVDVTSDKKFLVLSLGFSHMICVEIPQGVTISVSGDLINISGVDIHAVSNFAALLCNVKRYDPYKGKGIVRDGAFRIVKDGKKGK
ncbi:50S ribosomal protein L6 [Candidatus Deianiraea vastatrix]|uniref:50S ribosomal protein L6 n=1 Tax=Candidatus Deianiraea vastatrix TaxID=2163644 RepID=A0A5B8XD22_9RICK|nr:50S ribosomal protein L6 [Candidatus Deianiraea vastatrix]QED23203.1 50S ribosomal protein L6 [Candidatus Deianiraea vastatrix]